MKLLTAMIMVGGLCVACHSTRNTEIEGTIDAFYKAQQSHDGEAFRSMVTPPLRERPDTARMIKDNEKCIILSWKIGSIHPGLPITNAVGRTLKTVSVPMEVKAQFAGDTQPRILKNLVDQWVLVDGKWCWFYTGYPVD